MKQRFIDGLLLDQQAGTDLRLSANAERVDALISGRLSGAWTHDLPVIVFRTLINSLFGLLIPGESQQIDSSIVVDIRSCKNSSGYDLIVK